MQLRLAQRWPATGVTSSEACLLECLWKGLTSSTMQYVTCNVCELDIEVDKAICLNPGRDAGVNYRCKLCNNLNGRIYRVKGKVQWESQEARKHFFLQNNTLSGKSLKKELEYVTTQAEKETVYDNDEQACEWLDEIDLKANYENKPEQLQAIMQSAETRMHPVRKVKLYADVTFSSKRSASHVVETELKRKCTSYETLKAPKKSKKDKNEFAEEEAKGRAAQKSKPITKAQKAQLVKLEQRLGKIKDDWSQHEQHSDDDFLKGFLPEPLVHAARKAIAEVDACMAEVPIVLTEGWLGNFHAVEGRVAAAVKSGETSNATLTSMIQMAAGMRGKGNA